MPYVPPHPKPPTVAILAKTTHLAAVLAQDMGVKAPLLLSPRALEEGKGRGVNLKCLIVDQSAWPITPKVKVAIMPCLKLHLGYIRVVTTVDPKSHLQ